MIFCCSLDYFVLVLFAFVVLDLVSSVLQQQIGCKERLRNDLFCVAVEVKTYNPTNSLFLAERAVNSEARIRALSFVL